MPRVIGLLLCLFVLGIGLNPCFARAAEGELAIACPSDPSALEMFAAREVRRYLYLRTGVCLPIVTAERFEAERHSGFWIARKDRKNLQGFPVPQSLTAELDTLGEQSYRLNTISDGPRKIVMVCGGGDTGTLYGAYRLSECLGVRFYLDGDVVPDERIPLDVPDVDERGAPLFKLRGILPFHDFPEGPDWWNLDDYKSVLAQLAKLKMNFIGLHTYLSEDVDNGWCEPTIWMGLPQDVRPNGEVTFAYKSGYVTTHRGMSFDGEVKNTSDFIFGASQLFTDDRYGPDFMEGNIPLPQTPEDCVDLFNRHGRLFRDAFEFARDLDIKTCIGSNTPLAIPMSLQERLQALGKDPADPRIRQELYEGAFTRAARTHPLDYYWFWTHEGWLDRASEEEIQSVKEDWFCGLAAAKAIDAPFTLATSGWVLGPPSDRSLFDKWLPKEMPLSCISRSLGVEPVDATFADISGRSKWSIPWLEDDPAMISLQLWAGRMRADAMDSLKYGCDGLMGIHWRTKCIGPTLAALAQAAWEQGEWAEPQPPSEFDKRGEVLGGHFYMSLTKNIAGTRLDDLYRSIRYDMTGYHFSVPNGTYTVTLHFCETGYSEPEKRVFDVKVQNQFVRQGLDLFTIVGKDRAYDIKVEDVVVRDGKLAIDFNRGVEYPCISGIRIENGRYFRGVNCGGRAVGEYEADWPIPGPKDRFRPVDDFYLDWAEHNFGANVSEPIAALFTRIDGYLPRPSTWEHGPGLLFPESRPWYILCKEYEFVEELAALRPRIKGAGNLARFDYWLNTLQCLEAQAKVDCAWKEFNQAMERVKAATEARERIQVAKREAVPARIRLVESLEELYRFFLGTVDTPGELGTLSNIEQRSLPRLLDRPTKELVDILGEPLPAAAMPSRAYNGTPRIIVPTVRTTASPGEILTLKVMLLDRGALRSATLHWRRMGQGDYQAVPLNHIERGVYSVQFPPEGMLGMDIEYYIEVRPSRGGNIYFPATAPDINQTVVVLRN